MTREQVFNMLENDTKLKDYYNWLKTEFGNERAERFIKKMEEI